MPNQNRSDENKKKHWDKRSKDQSDKNFVLGGQAYGNPWNNTDNPNWANKSYSDPYAYKLNDPQRVEDANRLEDNNGNKRLMKDEKYKEE